jgi:uncharacterized protein
MEISVTEKCNLGCPYCYVANKDSFMSIETFDKAIKNLDNFLERSGQTKFNASFFGGEPLLNWELIKYATPKLRAMEKCNGIVLISNLTMIDEEKRDWLLENKVGVSWSFDGMSSNVSRPLLPMLENNNSTGKMYDGILSMYEDKKDLILSLTNGCKHMVWPGNVSDMSDNFDFFLDWGIVSPDYSIVRDDVWSKDDLIAFRENLILLVDKWIDYIKNGRYCGIGFITLAILDMVFGMSKGKRPFGCFAGTHGCVMTSEGEFYPCARFAPKKLLKMEDDFNFNYYSQKFSPKNFDKCQSCDLYAVCNAGCTYSQVLNDNKPVDSVCELFHIIYEQAQRATEELKDEPVFQDLVLNAFNNIG